MSEYKPLPIGVDNFKVLIEKDYYHVDKTFLIKDLLDLQGKVTLFTRPRRFGKTLNMSMLRYFFEMPENEAEMERQRRLFQGLAIMEAGEKVTARMGQNPVIFLTLKSGKQPSWELAHSTLCGEIRREYSRHSDVLLSAKLPPEHKERFLQMLQKEGTEADYHNSLQFLSECLERAYERKAVILIDEYDIPLENSYFRGFYDEMAGFLRSLFKAALKANESLEFAVISGSLLISKESIFTGLDDLKVISIRNTSYAKHFGFTQEEVDEILSFYGCMDSRDEVKAWYGGYLFGDVEVYNPWSVMNHVKQRYHAPNSFAVPYWFNTSGNASVRTLIENEDAEVRGEIETLIGGGTIEKPVHEDITYNEIHSAVYHLWNVLYFTGCLTKVSERKEGENAILLTLRIPNAEVKCIYEDHICAWFDELVSRREERKNAGSGNPFGRL